MNIWVIKQFHQQKSPFAVFIEYISWYFTVTLFLLCHCQNALHRNIFPIQPDSLRPREAWSSSHRTEEYPEAWTSSHLISSAISSAIYMHMMNTLKWCTGKLLHYFRKQLFPFLSLFSDLVAVLVAVSQ